ncbi:MAG: CdaR family protein [Lachnospiraceae bacterium]|jgi:YbbR domain-containing protein|nr:CdaR family protein [Lachnospiraceae bacterium]
MKEKKKPDLFENLGLRIIALIAAVITWLLVTNINDPVTYMQFYNVPVKILNTALITDQGDVYTVLDDSDVIPVVTVTAPRSIIDALGEENIIATADVKNLSSLNTVSISLTTNKYYNKITSIKGSIDTVRLSVESKSTSIFALNYEVKGKPADGYVQGDVTLDQNQVRISGPASVVSGISKAVASVDIGGASATITTSVDVKLYDAAGNAVDTESLIMNISSVKMTVTILPTKDVTVTGKAQGTPADGYLLTGKVTFDPETVKLAGRASVLASAEAIDIPADVLDATGATGDTEKTINIKPYLPENTSFADKDFDGTVKAVIGVEAASAKVFEIDPAEIALRNVPDGCTAEITAGADEHGNAATKEDMKKLSVTLSGLASVLDGMSVSDLSPYVDVGKLAGGGKSGVYSTEVSYFLPEFVTAADRIRVAVTVNNAADAAAQDSSASGSSTGG